MYIMRGKEYWKEDKNGTVNNNLVSLSKINSRPSYLIISYQFEYLFKYEYILNVNITNFSQKLRSQPEFLRGS